MNSSDKTAHRTSPTGAVWSAITGTQTFVRERIQKLDVDFFSNISEESMIEQESQAVRARRFNVLTTLLAILPVMLLTAYRYFTGQELAADPSAAGMAPDFLLGLCLLAVPLVMLAQMAIPLDGGQLVLQKLARAHRQSGDRQTFNSPQANAYRSRVKAQRGLRVIDVDCMRTLHEAHELEQRLLRLRGVPA